jgi:hypothetical protein
MMDSMELGLQIVKCGIDNLGEAVAMYEKAMLPRAADFIQRCEQSGNFMFAPDSPKGFLDMLNSYAKGQLLADGQGVKN